MAFSASSEITNTEPDYSAHISEMQEIRGVELGEIQAKRAREESRVGRIRGEVVVR